MKSGHAIHSASVRDLPRLNKAAVRGDLLIENRKGKG
jgi:hypothetical protein